MRISAVFVCLFLTPWGLASPAHAQWATNGNPVSVAAGLQNNTSTLSDGAGGAFVVWQDWSTGSANLVLQRITAAGAVATGWPAAGLVLSTAASDQKSPAMAPDGAGGVYIAWEDYRSGGANANIYAVRITGAGVVATGWTAGGTSLCTSLNAQGSPTIAVSGGYVIVAWQDDRSGIDTDIYAQRYSAAGVRQWTFQGIPLCTAAGSQMFPAIVADGAGGVFATWQDRRFGGSDVYAQRVTSAGAMSWAADGIVLCDAVDDQLAPRLIADGYGGAIVTWDDYRNFNSDVYALRIDAAGAAQWASDGVPLCTDLAEQYGAQPVPDGSGGVLVPWNDYRGGSGDLYLQRLDSSGVVPAGWPVNGRGVCTVDGDQFDPVAVGDGMGGVILAWSDARATSVAIDIYVQRITGSGAIASGWDTLGVVVCNAANGQYRPSVGSSGSGDALVAWHDERSGAADIYLRRVTASGSVGVELPQAARDFDFAPPAPNPARDGAMLRLRLAEPSPARLEILDLGGRAVRLLLDSERLEAGTHALRWDGRDGEGRPVPTGQYFVRFRGQAHSEIRKLTVLR